VLGLSALMTTTKSIVAALALLAGALYFGAKVYRTKSQVTAAAAAINRLQAQLADASASIRKLQKQQSLASANLPKSRALSAEEQRRQDFVASLNDPERRRSFLQLYRVRVRYNYLPLYSALQLSSDQIQQFEGSIADTFAQRLTSDAWRGFPDNVLPDDYSVELAGPLRTILGEDGYQEYLDYNQTAPARNAVSQLVGRTRFSDAPLTPDQASRLAQVFAANSPDYRNGGALKLTEEVWNASLTQAKSFLAAQQFEALQGVRIRAQALDQLNTALAEGSSTP